MNLHRVDQTLSVVKITVQAPVSVTRAMKEILLIKSKVVAENAKRTMNVPKNLHVSETSALILVLALAVLTPSAKFIIMFRYALVRLDTREIHSSNVEKNLLLHLHVQTLAFHRLVVQTHNVERLTVKAYAHAYQIISEALQVVDPNAWLTRNVNHKWPV